MNPGRYFLPLPAIPANNATVVLFCTRPKTPSGGTRTAPALGSIDNFAHRIDAVTVVFLQHNKASAANGLRAYGWDAPGDDDPNTGAQGVWRETDLKDDNGVPSCGSAAPIQVPALAAGQEFRRTFIVGHLFDKAIEYTAGADNPENWAGYIVLDVGAAAVVK